MSHGDDALQPVHEGGGRQRATRPCGLAHFNRRHRNRIAASPESGHAETVVTDHLNIVALPDGRKRVNQYTLLEILGKGSYGKVKLALDSRSGVKYAVKIVDKSLLMKKRFLDRSAVLDQVSCLRQEIEVMKLIKHVNIVRLHEIIDDPDQNKIYLVMEHMVLGPIINLNHHNCHPLPESTCKSHLRDILSGLEYLHSRHIAHRDIKPDNLLLSVDGIVKIADFGVSMQFVNSDDFTRVTAGSLAFMAPEMCLSEGAAYSARITDIWSAGISLYAMLFDKVPFTASTSSELYETISKANLEWPRPLSPGLERLLLRLLDKDPAKRITLYQLKEDPWLTDNGKHSFVANQKRLAADHDYLETPESSDPNNARSSLNQIANCSTNSHPFTDESSKAPTKIITLVASIKHLCTRVAAERVAFTETASVC